MRPLPGTNVIHSCGWGKCKWLKSLILGDSWVTVGDSLTVHLFHNYNYTVCQSMEGFRWQLTPLDVIYFEYFLVFGLNDESVIC